MPPGRHCRPHTLLLLGLLAVLPATAQEVRYGDVVVRTLPDLPQSASHGYHEFPFLVTNESSTASRRVTLQGSGGSVGHGLPHLGTIERTVTVGPGAAVRMTLRQPPLPISSSGLRVSIDGRWQREVIPWHSEHPDVWHSGSYRGARAGGLSRRVLIGQRLSEDGFPPHSEDEYRVLRAVAPIASWSESWLAYSGFDGVVLSAEELEGAPVGVLGALYRYVETGGSLLSLGRPDPGSVWGRWRAERPHASETRAGLAIDYAGFGVLLSADDAARVDRMNAFQLDRLEESWKRTRGPWGQTRNPVAAHRQFPVVEKVEIPVRGLFLVMFFFTVLIGPVNLVLLRRRGKRLWLLFTVPAASLLTCGLVVFYALMGEGLVRYSRSAGLTILDERSRRATTYGWTGFYATLTPGDGLRFAADTEVSPVVSWSRDQRNPARDLECGDVQHLSLGWLRARLPSYIVVRKSELRRERLGLRRTAGRGLEVVNGLGVDLDALWVADHEGRVHGADDPIAAGAAATLSPLSSSAAGGADVLRDLYRGDLLTRMRRLAQDPVSFLRPGSYIAVARASPFIETALSGVDRATDESVIYGLLRDGEI